MPDKIAGIERMPGQGPEGLHGIVVRLDRIGWWREDLAAWDLPCGSAEYLADHAGLDAQLREAIGPGWRMLRFRINRRRHVARCYAVPAKPTKEA
jgi:hypothetical protein